MATQPKPKKNRTTLWIIIAMVVLIAALAIYNRSKKDDGIAVETGEVELRDVYAKVSESGVIQPTIDVPVAADVSGEVVKLYVQEGMKVKKGDLLLTIQPDNYEAALEQAQAALDQARAGKLQAQANLKQSQATMLQDSVNMARNKQLQEEGVISQLEYENSQLRYKVSRSQYEAAKFSVQASGYSVQSAAASVKQARQSLDRTNIYASMDGTITKLNVEVGQRVVGTMQMAGTEILKIADLSSMEVVVEINENDIVNINLGDSSRIEVDAFPDDVFFGKVTEIAYSAQNTVTGSDQVTNFEVKVMISPQSYRKDVMQVSNELIMDESPFRPGMTALVEIFTEWQQDAVTVPIQSVTLSKKKDKKKDEEKKDTKPQEVVYVVKDGLAREVAVNTGISDETHMVIKGGVQEGEKVVIGPYTTLTKTLKDSTEVMEEKEEK
jgi:HlyD family secretion protein